MRHTQVQNLSYGDNNPGADMIPCRLSVVKTGLTARSSLLNEAAARSQVYSDFQRLSDHHFLECVHARGIMNTGVNFYLFLV